MENINEDDVAARYQLVPTETGEWQDMQEAKPRARARVTGDAAAELIVTKDGRLHYDRRVKVEVDSYQDPKYAELRTEGRPHATQQDS